MAATAGTAKRRKSTVKEKRSPFAFIQEMDDQKKRVCIKVTGLVIGAFAVFTFLAVMSYLFTWKTDQSLLSDPEMMKEEVEISNMAGKLGYKWALFLVTRCFGLGSFAIVFLLGALSYRMVFGKMSMGVSRTLLVSFSGAFVFSLLFAFFSGVFHLETAFGGGLGGDCGEIISDAFVNMTGSIVTFIIFLIFLVMWLLLASGSFSRWMSRIGRKKPVPAAEEAVAGPTPVMEEIDLEKPNLLQPDSQANEDVENFQPAENPALRIQEVPQDQSPDAAQPAAVPESAAASAAVPVSVTPAAAAASAAPASAAAPAAQPEHELEVISGEGLSTEISEELPRIDVREELEKYQFPSLDLLEDYASGKFEVASDELERNNNKIRATLQSYKIQINRVTACVGPTVTLYKVIPAPGVKISAIKSLEQDIAMSLNARGVRVVPLSDSVGIEVANDRPSIVPLKSIMNDDSFRNSKAELPIALGYTITQKVKVFDLADAPHLLVAGATKQGKSVGLNVIINSLLYSKHPSELKFVFIDPKMVEFTAYARLLKHYLAVMPSAASSEDEMDKAIVKDPKQAEEILRSLCVEMDERYLLMSKAFVNNIKLYNDKYRDRHLLPTEGHRFLPYLVVVIDEYADLIMTGGMGQDNKNLARSITTSVIRLAQKGRAAGLHVIIATQRPSVDVITGLIKTNFPVRIAFRVSNRIDSSTILGSPGAEKLIGRGDMLFYTGINTERVQCALIDIREINRITEFIGSQTGYKKSYNTPYYLPSVSSSDDSMDSMIDMKNIDPLFEEAATLVVTNQQGSTSFLQRNLGIGYPRAGKVMDQLEGAGIVGPQEGSKPRQLLVADLAELEPILKSFLEH